MSRPLKATLLILMSTGFFFGFMHLFLPVNSGLNFERLHIFFFNLCCGGTIILYYTQGERSLTPLNTVFLVLSISYALCAFLELYLPAMILAVLLAIIVEIFRSKRFSLIPVDFIRSSVPIADKFHHAALLCLSVALLLSVAAIINEVYYHVTDLRMVKLNTFFLGFSFPVSLVTMAIMFSLVKQSNQHTTNYARQSGFWIINLGVIVFFLFILAELLIPQVVISVVLFISVVHIFIMFNKSADRRQTATFLRSGMFFLMFTSVTGVVYILLHFFPQISYEEQHFLLKIHAFSALYGWNLSGLAVISRFKDFPIRLNSGLIILLHWITVILLAPIGYYSKLIALPATLCYIIILYQIFFSQGISRSD